jgi:hypothetical protein
VSEQSVSAGLQGGLAISLLMKSTRIRLKGFQSDLREVAVFNISKIFIQCCDLGWKDEGD